MKSHHSNGYATKLDAAYRATAYVVVHPQGRVTLRVGQPNAELDALLESLRQHDWAFVTASNPGSQRLPQAENARRNGQLMAAVEAQGWHWLPATGLPDQGEWPPEASLLVLGIPLQQALQLASAFGQNAILAGVRGGPAQLHYVNRNPAG